MPDPRPQPPSPPSVRELWGADESSLLYAAAACCREEDPADAAILRAAAERGVTPRDIDARRPLAGVHPLDDRGRMSVLRADGVLYVKGSPAAVLPRCTSLLPGTREANERMAARGLTVVAVATGSSDAEERLTLWGLIGL
ncbi:MAG TPA: hypothetical protein VND93_13265 [Myxococcales bacterium]|nr:hypothetical protein [Myxococcales bacterium]